MPLPQETNIQGATRVLLGIQSFSTIRGLPVFTISIRLFIDNFSNFFFKFYAIHYSQSYDIINTDEKAIEMQLKKIENSTAVHVWNSHTHINNISKSERTIYLILAQKNSPKVYEASPSIF